MHPTFALAASSEAIHDLVPGRFDLDTSDPHRATYLSQAGRLVLLQEAGSFHADAFCVDGTRVTYSGLLSDVGELARVLRCTVRAAAMHDALGPVEPMSGERWSLQSARTRSGPYGILLHLEDAESAEVIRLRWAPCIPLTVAHGADHFFRRTALVDEVVEDVWGSWAGFEYWIAEVNDSYLQDLDT